MPRLPDEHPWLYHMYVEEGRHAVQRTDHPLNGLCTDLVIEQVLMRSIQTHEGLTQGRGMTESVHHQWVYTRHQRATIHDAMTTLTNRYRNTSEQHKELGTTRKKHDGQDLSRILGWMDENNPFDPEVTELRSLSTGLVARAEDGVNCDDAESVGAQIPFGLDGVLFKNT